MNEQVKFAKGKNYSVLHTGTPSSWKELYGTFGSFAEPVRGKYFIKNNLDMKGLEISINSFPPGREMPFIHRHNKNDELYFVLSGGAMFYIDGEFQELLPGSFIRMAPGAERSFKSHDKEPLLMIVVQFPHDSEVVDDVKDGMRVPGAVNWPASTP